MHSGVYTRKETAIKINFILKKCDGENQFYDSKLNCSILLTSQCHIDS